MSNAEIPVTGVVNRQPTHASITEEQISDLVERFYGRIRDDALLGPIFEARIAGNWPPHLAKMKGFWRSVLLKTGEYNGRPLPVHVRLGGIEDRHYAQWLRLFRLTVKEIFETEAQPLVIEAAERIASSFWLATSGNLLGKPPQWPE